MQRPDYPSPLLTTATSPFLSPHTHLNTRRGLGVMNKEGRVCGGCVMWHTFLHAVCQSSRNRLPEGLVNGDRRHLCPRDKARSLESLQCQQLHFPRCHLTLPMKTPFMTHHHARCALPPCRWVCGICGTVRAQGLSLPRGGG